MSTRRDTEVTPALVQKVQEELSALCARQGPMSLNNLLPYETLVSLGLPASDPLDAARWVTFRAGEAGKLDKAVHCAQTLAFGVGESVQDRLIECGERYDRDARSIRRWVEIGLPRLAYVLVSDSLGLGSQAIEVVYLAWNEAQQPGRTALSMRWLRPPTIRYQPRLTLEVQPEAHEPFRYNLIDGLLEWRNRSGDALLVEAGYVLDLPPLSEHGFPTLTLRFESGSAPAVHVLNLLTISEVTYTPMFGRGVVTFVPDDELDAELRMGMFFADEVIELDFRTDD